MQKVRHLLEQHFKEVDFLICRNSPDIGGYNRGYECLRSQNFEKQGKGDFKEGYYMGKNLPLDDQYVIDKRFGQGPNKYPAELRDPKEFQRVMDEYHEVMTKLAKNLLQVLACTLSLPTNYFDDFCEHPVAALRLLHYPPQDPATTEVEKGKLLYPRPYGLNFD